MKLYNIFEIVGFLLIIVGFIFGDKIPTSIELKWIIVAVFFIFANNLRMIEIKDDLVGTDVGGSEE